MKRIKYYLSVLLTAALIVSMTACGTDESTETVTDEETEIVEETEEETIQEPEEEVTIQDIALADLDVLVDAGIITGVKDLKIEEGTDVDLNELVFVDDTIITSVDIDDSAVDYSKADTYEAIYTITFDGEALRSYLEENELTVTFDTSGESVVVKTTITLEIITVTEAEEAVAEDETEVVTNETKSEVQSKNAAEATPTAKPSSSSNSGKNNSSTSGSSSGTTSKPSSGSGTTSNSTTASTSKPSSGSGSSSGSSSSASTSKPSSGSGSSSSGSSSGSTATPTPTQKPSTPTPTQKPSTPTPTPAHTHSYTSKVTKAATCGSAGVRTYTCSCGDSYTETIPATGSHTWVAQTKTVHHDEVGHYETVTITDAYDEPVYESRAVCNQCGYSSTSADEVLNHIMTSDTCQNYSVKNVAVGTVHHDAVTEQRWVVDQKAYDETVTTGYKCSVCGATK